MSIKINIGLLKEGSQTEEILTDCQELGIDEPIVKDKVLIMLEMFKSNNQIDVKSNIKGKFNFHCDRCLDLFEFPFESSFEIVLSLISKRDDSSDQNEIENIKYYKPNYKIIDITKDIRDNILLSVPMRKIPEEINGKCCWCGKTQEYWKKFFKEEEI